MNTMNDYVGPGDFKPIDLLAVAAAREVRDGDIVFAGTGLPMLAIALAQLTTAPNAVCIYEAGSVDGRPISIPTSVGDARCSYQAAIASGTFDVTNQLQRGVVDLAFLGGAEIDRYGNVNTTAIGRYGLIPQKRLPGGGGNSDINSLARRTVFTMVQEKRRFKENVDFITSPGWRIPKWPGGEMVPKAEVYNKAMRGGPSAVISDMGVFYFDADGEMYLDTVHPGFTPEQVRDNCSFDLNISRVKGETLPPTRHELELLYKTIDPEGIFLP
ncbi:MAG: CoA-transferase [Syntrophomonadaceae bacterium]|nr:CoA-transferase [Syntrophomonadaceae bacterium]